MASLIQIRRGTLAEWQAANPVLSNGEITFVTDENKIKIGNGTNNWSSLPYLEAAIDPDSIVLGQDTTGSYVEIIDGGSGISISGSGSESASVTITNTGVLSLLGTENEITVSASSGDITLSLPNTINANTTGSAASLTTARTISLGGDLSGSASFDGTSNITITASVDPLSSVNSINGTENEISVSASVGDITISLPETINANTTGAAASLTTARTIALSGDLSGSASFDGSASVDIVATIQPDSVSLGSDTTGNYVSQVTGTGAGISVSGSGESASVTIENTGVTSLAGTENEIDISASTGSVTLSLPSTINANTTGSAATLTNSRVIALSGDISGSVTFDGSASVDINTQIQPNSVALGTDTTGNYVATASGGTGISISGSGSEDSAITINNTGVVSLTGTANQIAVSASNGDSTLSFPSAVIFPGTVTLNANPSQALEAVTKQYVDAIAEGLHVHASVATATTASVDLGDAPASIDGVTLTDGMRVLVKNQSDTAQNGIYTYSASADALVRASDFNSPAEIQGGDFLFVTDGDTYSDTGWVQTELVTTLGTDPILFTQFSGAGTYTAGVGLQLDGTVFSNTGVLSLQGTTNEVEVSASSGSITVSLPETINANTTGSAATLTTSRTIELTGDVTGSASFNGGANATVSSTLANTAVTPDTYGSASAVGTVTVDSKGRVTGASNTAIAIAQSAVTNLTTDLGLKAPLASPTFTGTVSLPSTTSIGNVSSTELGYIDGVTSAIQTQINAKANTASPSFTGTVSASVVTATGIVSANSFKPGYTTQLANNGSTTLTAASTEEQFFTGSSPHSVTMPVTSTLSLGHRYRIVNNSLGTITVNSSGLNQITTIPSGSSIVITCILTSGTTAASWDFRISGTKTVSGTGNPVYTINSSMSGTTIQNANLTGSPVAPTANPGTNTTQVATTAFVASALTTLESEIEASMAITDINTQASSYTAQLSDSGKIIEISSASATNISIPSNSSVAFPIGSTLDIIQYGSGQVTINPLPVPATWTTITINASNPFSGYQDILYTGSQWVATAGDFSPDGIFNSTNGITWTSNVYPASSNRYTDIAYGNGQYVLAIRYRQDLQVSTDLTTWTTSSSNIGAYQTINSVAYGNGLWVAVGDYGQIRTSTDTVTWTTQTSVLSYSGSNKLNSVAYGNGLWAVGGYTGSGGVIAYSTDAITWTTAISDTRFIQEITYGGSVWLAGGSYHTIYKSTDAITWTTATTNPAAFDSVTSITYATSGWYATAGSKIFTSTDTVTWTTTFVNPQFSPIYSIAFDNSSVMVAGGVSGFSRRYDENNASQVVVRSKDGNLKLTGQYSGATLYKRGTDEWVAVGDLTT